MFPLFRPIVHNFRCAPFRISKSAPVIKSTKSIIFGTGAIRSFSQNLSPKQVEAMRKLRSMSQKEIDLLAKEVLKKRHRDQVFYIVGFAIFMLGGCWAAIPIYRIFCQDNSYGGGMGKYKRDKDIIDTMHPVKERPIRVHFTADAAGKLAWQFRPLQDVIHVSPGETALAFFTATNSTDQPIIGVSTYNIVPYDAAAYFNKIQCFCFDEQLLNPGEQVDLPIFFYLDPDFAFDPLLANIDEVVLSYTFFQSKANQQLQLRRPADYIPSAQTLKENSENVVKNIGQLTETAKM